MGIVEKGTAMNCIQTDSSFHSFHTIEKVQTERRER